MVVMKLDRDDGHEIWQRLIDGPAHGDDRAWTVIVGPDDHPVVAGLAPTSAEEAGFLTAKLRASDGTVIWSRTLAGAILNPDDKSCWLTILPGGDVVLAGKTWGASYDVLLHRFDATDGSQVWHQQFNTGGTSADEPRGMIRNSAGDQIYVAGVRGGDYMALGFGPEDGQLNWSSGYNGPPGWYDAATCLVEGPGGEVIVGGYSSGATTGWDATVVAFDPSDGHQLWDRRYDPGLNETDELTVLRVGPSGELYAGGYTYTAGTYNDMLVLFYRMETLSAPESPLDPTALHLVAGPNPFRQELRVSFELPTAVETRVDVYDLQGRRAARLAAGLLPGGLHRLEWNGRDESGRPAADGIYLIRIEAGARSRTTKVVRLGASPVR